MKNFTTTMLFLMVLFLFTASSTALAYTITGHVECETTGMVPYGAVFKVYEVDPLPGGGYTKDEITLTASATVDENGNFTINSSTPYGSGGFESGGPDLLLALLQNINGTVETIYQENWDETHWNIVDGSTLPDLKITSALAVFYNPGITSTMFPNDKYFTFTRVGNCETAEIDCKGSDATSQGYNHPRKLPYSFSGISSDQPFGRTLDLFGIFGNQCNIDYYKIKYLPDGLADIPGNWKDVDTNLPNKWYDRSDPNSLKWHWVSESMGPVPYGSENNLYQIPYKKRPGEIWSYLDRVARFDSQLTANGLCKIKINGYVKSGSSLISATSANLLLDTNYGTIVLQIDNTPPIVGIVSMKLNNITQAPCNILNFGSAATDQISVFFKVWDPRGHLREYKLEALYGHNQKVTPIPLTPDKGDDNYDLHSSPSWQGDMNYHVDYTGSVYDSLAMPTCAYQFRLHASKRTTDGYDLIYEWVEDTWHVTIQR
jgi:hypothetical protein